MNFLGVGPWELLIIFIMAFLVFGPERLPEIARGLGKALRDFRQMSQGVMESVSEMRNELEMASDSVTSPLMEIKEELEQASRELTAGLGEVAESVERVAGEVREMTSLEIGGDKMPRLSEVSAPDMSARSEPSLASATEGDLKASDEAGEVEDEEAVLEPEAPSTPAELGVPEMEEEMPATEVAFQPEESFEG